MRFLDRPRRRQRRQLTAPPGCRRRICSAMAAPVVDYMEVVGKGQKITRPSVPWMAIPTTAGTAA